MYIQSLVQAVSTSKSGQGLLSSSSSPVPPFRTGLVRCGAFPRRHVLPLAESEDPRKNQLTTNAKTIATMKVGISI